MGCGTSRNEVMKSVVPSARPDPDSQLRGKNETSTIKSTLKPENTISATGVPNGNGVSGPGKFPTTIPSSLPPVKPPRGLKVGFMSEEQNGNNEELDYLRNMRKNVPVAFEVPADTEASLIKRHPPKRLLRAMEDPPDEQALSLTHELLEEKVQQANQRRTQVLSQRVASARSKSARAGRIGKPVMGDFNAEEFEAKIQEGTDGLNHEF